MLLVALAMFGVFFFVSLYMQNMLGYSAVQAGAAFLPMTILIILIAPLAGKLSDRHGSRWLMTDRDGAARRPAPLLLPAHRQLDLLEPPARFPVGGLGMALTMTPTAAAATRAVPVEKSGVGSAVLNAVRQVGGSVGIALMGAIFAHEANGKPRVEGFMAGFERSLTVAAVIAFVGAAVAFALVRQETHEEESAPSRSRHDEPGDTSARDRAPAGDRRSGDARFVGGSYSGATTAEIARAAGVSEPILYRHFGSKRELYLACLQSAWDGFREALDTKLETRGDLDVVRAVGEGAREFHASGGVKPVTLWIQALTEAGEDEEIRAFLREQLREVHDYIADALRRGQADGDVPADRVPDAEAWIFVGASFLIGVCRPPRRAPQQGGHGGDRRPAPPLADRQRLTRRERRELQRERSDPSGILRAVAPHPRMRRHATQK